MEAGCGTPVAIDCVLDYCRQEALVEGRKDM